MAVRYAGDVEARCELLYGETYRVRVRYRKNGQIYFYPTRITVSIGGVEAGSPESYDVVARAAILAIRKRDPDMPLEYGSRGRKRGNPSIVVRRVYQAPCPESAWTPRRKK